MSDDIEVSLEDPPADDKAADPKDNKTETPAKPDPKVVTAEEGIDDLKRKLAEADTARRLAEQQAIDAQTARREAEVRAQTASKEADDTNLNLVNNAISHLKRDTEVAKAALKAAYATQNWDAVADAQEAISTNAAKLLQLENGKAEMEKPKPAPRAAQVDPVDRLASQLTPRSAAWVRAHPEYARDERLYNKMIAAHRLVTAEGTVVADTDGYFSAIENALGIKAPEADDPTGQAAQVVGGRQASAPPAAPVSRPTSPGVRPNTVNLTRDEQEMAAAMGMTNAEYAKNKLALQKEGKLK